MVSHSPAVSGPVGAPSASTGRVVAWICTSIQDRPGVRAFQETMTSWAGKPGLWSGEVHSAVR